MTYESITTSDPNPVKRWIHKHRFSDALRVLKNLPPYERLHILDFGGGNGELLYHLKFPQHVYATFYEPTPSLMAEAKQKLASRENIKFAETSMNLHNETFNLIFCLEVFEHLPEAETAQALAEICRLLKPDGYAVIGVPIEIYFPALVKGIFRMSRRYGEFDASPINVLSAMIGKPPSQRPAAEITSGFNYHFHHLGFDYRSLQCQIDEKYTIKSKWYSPFPGLGSMLNSEVYYLIQKTKVMPAEVSL